MKRVGRDEPCPCESGKKYKHCCWNKGFQWIRDSDGIIYKQLPFPSDDTLRVLGMGKAEFEEMVRAGFDDAEAKFRKRHGREPGPGDFLFGHPEHIEARMVDLMKEANIPPHLIYAYQKTGRLVTEANKKFLTDAELEEWHDAVNEYFERYGDEGVEGE